MRGCVSISAGASLRSTSLLILGGPPALAGFRHLFRNLSYLEIEREEKFGKGHTIPRPLSETMEELKKKMSQWQNECYV